MISKGRRSPLLRQPSRKTLTDLCRRLVVEIRDQNTCQRCGSKDRRLEWCHIMNRGAKSLVYVPWATLALCGPRRYRWTCHYWFDSNHSEALLWWREKFPDRALKLDFWYHSEPHKVDRIADKLFLEQELRKYGEG